MSKSNSTRPTLKMAAFKDLISIVVDITTGEVDDACTSTNGSFSGIPMNANHNHNESHRTEQNRTEQNRTGTGTEQEQNRTGQDRTQLTTNDFLEISKKTRVAIESRANFQT